MFSLNHQIKGNSSVKHNNSKNNLNRNPTKIDCFTKCGYPRLLYCYFYGKKSLKII